MKKNILKNNWILVLIVIIAIVGFIDSYNFFGLKRNIGVINNKTDLIYFWTFLAIIWYSWETRILRKRTEERTEYEFRPFFLFEKVLKDEELKIRNLGKDGCLIKIEAIDNNSVDKIEIESFSGLIKNDRAWELKLDEDCIKGEKLKQFLNKYDRIRIVGSDTLNSFWEFEYKVTELGEIELLYNPKKIINNI